MILPESVGSVKQNKRPVPLNSIPTEKIPD